MKAVALIGFPFSGKRTLGEAIAARDVAALVTTEDWRAAVDASSTRAAALARDQFATGAIPATEVVVQLWWEATPRDRDAVLVGFPRTQEELALYERLSESSVGVVHLRARVALINQRMRAAGARNMGDGHPGAVERLTVRIDDLCRVAHGRGTLLTLDAQKPTETLVDAAVSRFWPQKSGVSGSAG